MKKDKPGKKTSEGKTYKDRAEIDEIDFIFYIFLNYANWKQMTISPSITSIGYNSFQHCSSLWHIATPFSVTSIDK